MSAEAGTLTRCATCEGRGHSFIAMGHVAARTLYTTLFAASTRPNMTRRSARGLEHVWVFACPDCRGAGWL